MFLPFYLRRSAGGRRRHEIYDAIIQMSFRERSDEKLSEAIYELQISSPGAETAIQ